MANPTTNFGWQMPTSTDLVTDLPADFEVFGQAVDTSLVDLKGGTTGQVLSKASNTDMDFTWVAQDDSNAIQNAIVDAKGDLITATAADTPARLAVGTNGQTLVADSSTSTGLKWATPSGGGKVLQVVSGTTTTATTITSNTYTDTTITATITPTASTSKILVSIMAAVYYTRGSTGAGQNIGGKLLRDSTSLMQNDYIAFTEITGSTSQFCAFLIPITYLDSPATTSATTYKLQGRLAQLTSSTSIWQHSSYLSTITLLEIGA